MSSQIRDKIGDASVYVQCMIDSVSVKRDVQLGPDYNMRKTLDDIVKVGAYIGSSVRIRVVINNSIDVIGFAIHGQTRQHWGAVSFDHILRVLL